MIFLTYMWELGINNWSFGDFIFLLLTGHSLYIFSFCWKQTRNATGLNISVWNINSDLCFLADTAQLESLINNLIILGKQK